MSVGRRRLSRTVAAALVLLAGVAVPAVPAAAAKRGPDLTVDASGTTIPLGVERKVVQLKVSNRGDETPREVVVRVRQPAEGPDPLPVALIWHSGGVGECDGDFGGFYCQLMPELIPGPGETADVPIDATVFGAAGPYEGTFEVSVTLGPDKDANPADNTRSFPLALVDQRGADLSVVARDVKQSVRLGADGRPEPTGTLHPGETGAVRHTVANQGRTAVSGVRVTLRLPKGVSFTRPPGQCVLGDGARSAVCTYPGLTLVPAVEDTDPNDAVYSAVELYNLVTTAASATAPATVRGGTVQVEGLAERPTNDRSTPARTRLPANAVAVPVPDVDPGDNRDGFAVVLAAKTGGGDGGSGDGGAGGTGGGDGGGDGGLPVTGPQAGLIGGIGVAAMVAGAVLFLAARRRRMVLVTPEDERPAA